MAWIGNTQLNQNYVPAIDYFNGDGSTVAFTLSRPVASVAQVQAVISNVPQNPGSAYTVSGNTITFTSAPPSGTANIYIYYTSPNTQVVQPGQGTVGATQIADGSITPAKLSTGYPYWDTAGNIGIGTSSPAVRLDIRGSGAQTIGGRRTDSSTTGIKTNFVGYDSSGNAVAAFDYIGDGADDSAYMRFRTRPTGGSLTEQARIDSAGLFKFNSGYGSTATAYGCRAWVNFNGTGTVAIRGSGNVSSITDGGNGVYTVTLITALPDTNACPVVSFALSAATTAATATYRQNMYVDSTLTVSMRIGNATVGTDTEFTHLAVFR